MRDGNRGRRLGRPTGMVRTSVGLASVVLLAALGCSGDDGTDVQAGDNPRSVPDDDTRYRGTLVVLEDTGHGPQMCESVEESYPPQCGGPDIVGWKWDDVDDEESANGTTWGSYEITGTWDGSQLTVTEPPGPPRHDEVDDTEFTSPCPEPAGGWTVLDATTAGEQAQQAAIAAAESRSDFAGVWLDSLLDPATAALGGIEAERAMTDPTKQVLNVAVTGDVAAAGADLREIWGGPLCVSEAEHTMAELLAVSEEIIPSDRDDPESVGSGIDVIGNQVEVMVYVDAGLQAELDDRFGPGLVEVQPALQPVE